MQTGRFIKSEKSKLGNPFRFRTVARSRTPYILGGMFFVFAALLYWLFFSPSFAIASISVGGNFVFPSATLGQLVKNQLTRTRWSIVPTHNIFAFESEELARTIKEQFAVEQVYVKKDRPHRIAVTVLEKPRQALWSTRNQMYALDSQGAVIGLPTADYGLQLPIVYDLSGGAVDIKQQVMATATLAFISKLWHAENIKLLQPRYFTMSQVNAADLTLKVGDTNGWSIYFDAAMPLQDQLNALDLTLRNSVSVQKRSKLDYIDLRFGERVYVKYR